MIQPSKKIINDLILLENKIIQKYKETYSVSDVLRSLNFTNGYRKYITKLLKEKNIWDLKKTHIMRVKKIEQTTYDRYGVKNIGELKNSGWCKFNKIEKSNVEFLKEYDTYREKVKLITNKNKKRMIDLDYCYYTGIKFVDADKNPSNPNDFLKKSIDHKFSKLYGFLHNISPEIIGSVENLAYCLKGCNSIKGSMSEFEFKEISKIIREKLKNEGKESN